MFVLCSMLGPTQRSTRTYPLFPYTTLFRSDWTALNLGPDAGIELLERANAWLAAQPAREQRRWVRAVQRQRLEFLGMVDFFARNPDPKVPKVLAPITSHYPRIKGLKLLGLSTDQRKLSTEKRQDGIKCDRPSII